MTFSVFTSHTVYHQNAKNYLSTISLFHTQFSWDKVNSSLEVNILRI